MPTQIEPKTQAQNAPLRELWDDLNRHDWFYSMSDDHSVWSAGVTASNRLSSCAASIDGGLELLSAFSRHIHYGQPKPLRPV